MGKKIVYTKITPLPSNVPRQLAVELLHSHEEVIKLNPLVTGVNAIETPRDSPNDEYFSQWYEINEVITWGFGMRKKIAFKGVFHDQPWGMQSHVYAPMGVDLRNKYRIGGNQPGEPREPRELGIDTPLDGLYLREDVEIVCNIALASFVKKETKEATGMMIARLAKKAELLDEGKLHALFENGRLKTSRPSEFVDRDYAHSLAPSSPGAAPGSPSPSMSSAGFGPGFGPRLDQKGFGKYHDVARTNSLRASGYMPAYQQHGYNGPDQGRPSSTNMPMINELPGDYRQQQAFQPQHFTPQGQVFRSELPGDTSFTPSPQPSPGQAPADFEKPPLQHPYAAYPAPPSHQHPADRTSVSTQGGGGHYHAYSISDASQRNYSVSSNGSRHNSYGPVGQALTTDHNAGLTAHQFSDPNGPPYPSSRPPSEALVPDHQRLSVQSNQSHNNSGGGTAPAIPPRDVRRNSAFMANGSGGNSGSGSGNGSASVKCPVCDLFEGDEAAVSHHVSKAHFT